MVSTEPLSCGCVPAEGSGGGGVGKGGGKGVSVVQGKYIHAALQVADIRCLTVPKSVAIREQHVADPGLRIILPDPDPTLTLCV